MQRVLGVFAKEPRPGFVKSRLAAATGAEPAARLYDAFLRDLLWQLARFDARRVLAFTPATARGRFAEYCADRFELEEQAGDDLGARMVSFFRMQFERGARQVVLLGSDSPDLPLERIDEAFAALDQAEVVLGPTDDGGYYLVGLVRPVPAMFADVHWGTGHVLAETTQRLAEIQIEPVVLPHWYDVDTVDDLRRLARSIQSECSPQSSSRLFRTSEQLQEMGYLSDPIVLNESADPRQQPLRPQS